MEWIFFPDKIIVPFVDAFTLVFLLTIPLAKVKKKKDGRLVVFEGLLNFLAWIIIIVGITWIRPTIAESSHVWVAMSILLLTLVPRIFAFKVTLEKYFC